MTHRLSHPYHLGESIFNFRASGVFFSFYLSFDEIHVNRIAPDGKPRFKASHMGLILFCLCPIKKDARLIWVKAVHFLKLISINI